MSKDAFELFSELEQKWNFEVLSQKFRARINEQLRTNSYTRDRLLERLGEIEKGF